jgi:hypothetical protein
LPDIVAGLHIAAFITLMPHRLAAIVAQSPYQAPSAC